MATVTSVGSGLWSAAGTWDTGVPVDDDVVVIATGHVVEFDVDTSAWANGINGLTITGTLSLTRTAGTYYLKVKAATTIGGAGTFDCGTSVSPIPFAAKHTIYMNHASSFIEGTSGLVFTCYAAEPTITHAHLVGVEGISSTVLEVDTDVTGDIWAVGDEVIVTNYTNGTPANERRIIAAAGIAAGSITITAGLTAAKAANSTISLLSRNVNFVNAVSSAFIFKSMSNMTIAGGEYDCTLWRCFSFCTTITITGGSFLSGQLFNSSSGITISDGVFLACTYVGNGSSPKIMGGEFYGCNTIIFNTTNGYFSGATVLGCANVMSTVTGAIILNSQFDGTNTLLNKCSAVTIYDITSTNSYYTFDYSQVAIYNSSLQGRYIANSSLAYFVNTTISFSTSEFTNYGISNFALSEAIDYNGVAGDYKAWSKGGVTTKQAVTYPTGHTNSMQTVLEIDTVEGYWQREVTVGAGASVNVTMNLRKDASMTYLPRIIVFNKASTDPFAGGAGLHTFTMTNSVDTWEDDLYTYTNATSTDVTLVLRAQGKSATGNLYSAIGVEQINVDLTTALANIAIIDTVVDAIKAKTDVLKNPSILIDGEIIA